MHWTKYNDATEYRQAAQRYASLQVLRYFHAHIKETFSCKCQRNIFLSKTRLIHEIILSHDIPQYTIHWEHITDACTFPYSPYIYSVQNKTQRLISVIVSVSVHYPYNLCKTKHNVWSVFSDTAFSIYSVQKKTQRLISVSDPAYRFTLCTLWHPTRIPNRFQSNKYNTLH